MWRDSDRTLPATRRRREQARQDGYVVQSRVLTTGLLLILLAVSWNSFGKDMMQSLVVYCDGSLSEWSVSQIDGRSRLAVQPIEPVLSAAAVWGGSLFVGALLIVGLQTRGWFMPRFALPHASRVSPLANVQRIGTSLTTRVLGAAVSIVICVVVAWMVWLRVQAAGLHTESSTQAIAYSWLGGLEAVTFQVAALCIVYGLLDLLWRHRRRDAHLRMTPDEWAQEQRSATRGAA